MNRYVGIALLVGMAAASVVGEDAVFHKSTIFDSHGKERKVDLVFLSENKGMVVREKTTIVANIPFGVIDKVAYGYSKRHRVSEGAQVAAAPTLIPCVGLECLVVAPVEAVVILTGVGLMLTKEKKHWLYVNYKDAGASKQLVLKLDKSEYQKVIAATKAQTGKDVEILPEEGKEKKK
jgi:hypothetical protein